MTPTATTPTTLAPDRDGDREQRAQVEVLEVVDVIDGPGEEVAAAPAGERGRHARREAVVEPHAPARECAQRGVVADQALGVAQRPAEEGEHLYDGEDAGDGGEARAQRGASQHVARAGQQPDGGGSRGEPEETGQGEPGVGGARLGQDAAQRPAPHGEATMGRGAGASRECTASKRVSRTGSCAATTTLRPSSHGSMAGASPRHGRRVERRGGLVEQEDGRRAQQGAGAARPAGARRRSGSGRRGRPRSPVHWAGWPPACAGPPRPAPAPGLLGGVGRADPEVLGQGGVEEVRALRQPGEQCAPLCWWRAPWRGDRRRTSHRRRDRRSAAKRPARWTSPRPRGR